MFTEEDLERWDDECAKAAQRYQDYVHQLKIFESLSKDMLAALKMEIRENGGEKMSESELDTRARATEKWKEFRKQEFAELKEAGRRQIQYENLQRRVEVGRTRISLRKRELERLGG